MIVEILLYSTLCHAKSFWNIIIRWTSHDDLTEKSAETFFHFTETALTHKTREMTKAQNCTLRFYEKTDSIEFHPSSN